LDFGVKHGVIFFFWVSFLAFLQNLCSFVTDL